MKTRTGKIIIGLVAVLVTVVGLIAVLPRVVRADTVEVGWEFIPFSMDITTPMTGWYKIQEGQMYDKVNNRIAATPTWTDCATAVTIDSYTGIYEDRPESTMPTGDYIWRLWDNTTASTDQPVKSKYVYWDASQKRLTRIADI